MSLTEGFDENLKSFFQWILGGLERGAVFVLLSGDLYRSCSSKAFFIEPSRVVSDLQASTLIAMGL